MSIPIANSRAIVSGFLVADIISAVLFAVYVYLTEKSGLQSPYHFLLLLLVGAAFSLIVIVVFAVPALLALRYLRLVNLWTALIVGFIAGVGMASLTEWPQGGLDALMVVTWSNHAVRRIIVFGVIGATSALGFWLMWKSS